MLYFCDGYGLLSCTQALDCRVGHERDFCGDREKDLCDGYALVLCTPALDFFADFGFCSPLVNQQTLVAGWGVALQRGFSSSKDDRDGI